MVWDAKIDDLIVWDKGGQLIINENTKIIYVAGFFITGNTHLYEDVIYIMAKAGLFFLWSINNRQVFFIQMNSN